MNKHVCVYGGNSAIAGHVIRHYLDQGDKVTAICRAHTPDIVHPNLVLDTWIDPGFPPIDVLVTLPGSVANAKLVEMDPADWDAVLRDCLTSVYEALRHGLRRMRPDGNVVVVGSVVGSTGGYGCANYAAAKAGLVGLVRAAANEHAGKGVCINLLELGYTDAGMGARLPEAVRDRAMATIPLKRFATVEEVVQAIVFLGGMRYMTGSILTLAGGLR